VRVRHVPSGRYLAVDTASGPCNNPDDFGSGPNAERWYRVCLVDDAALEEDDYYHDGTTNNNDKKDATAAARSPGGKTMLELDDGFKTVEPSRLEFHVASADVTDGDYIPDNDMNLRLEHHFLDPTDGSKQVIYLHNSEKRKPETTVSVHSTAAATATAAAAGGNSASLRGGGGGGSVIARSFRLVFSSVRSAQDIFKLMRLKEEEEKDLTLVKAFVTPIWRYAVAVADRSRPIADHVIGEEVVSLLLFIIAMQSKGHRGAVRDQGLEGVQKCEDWIRRANATLPAAFSKLFAGEPETFMQRTCREVKLLDAIFAALRAPYARTYESTHPLNPWSEAAGKEQGLAAAVKEAAAAAREELKGGVQALEKFLHVAVQRLCEGNAESQTYVR
jgi:hypothetical protein